METTTPTSPPKPSRWKRELAQLRSIILAVLLTLVVVYLFSLWVPSNTVPGPILATFTPQTQKAFQRDYDFSIDWFTSNIPVWEKALAPYKGKPGVRYLEVGAFEGMSCAWLLENILTDPTC